MNVDGSESDQNAEPLVSREELARLYGPIADELGEELIDQFRGDSMGYSKTLARLAGDLVHDPTAARAEIAYVAHTIKGSAAALGALGLTQAALDVETIAKTATTETVQEAISALDALLVKFHDLQFSALP